MTVVEPHVHLHVDARSGLNAALRALALQGHQTPAETEPRPRRANPKKRARRRQVRASRRANR